MTIPPSVVAPISLALDGRAPAPSLATRVRTLEIELGDDGPARCRLRLAAGWPAIQLPSEATADFRLGGRLEVSLGEGTAGEGTPVFDGIIVSVDASMGDDPHVEVLARGRQAAPRDGAVLGLRHGEDCSDFQFVTTLLDVDPEIHTTVATGSLVGRPRLVPGSVVSVGGAGARFDGAYRVAQVRHHFAAEIGYRSWFSAEKQD